MIAGVPKGTFRTAFECLASHLYTHPFFANKRIIQAWLTWNAATAPAPPPTTQMPAVQLRLLGGEMGRMASTRPVSGASTSASKVRLSILIDLWVKGGDQGDVADLGERIFDALFPQDRATRLALEKKFAAAGIRDWQMTRPILPPSAECFGDVSILASGSLDLTIHINS